MTALGWNQIKFDDGGSVSAVREAFKKVYWCERQLAGHLVGLFDMATGCACPPSHTYHTGAPFDTHAVIV